MTVTMFATPTEVAPGSTASWVDVDISAQITAGDTASGVVLEIVNTSITEYYWGVRKNGSTDTYTGQIEDNGHTHVCIGVDASGIFEANIENAAVEIWLKGYFTDDVAVFFTNAQDISAQIAYGAVWSDVDISSLTGANTAIAAFGLVDNSGNSGSVEWMARPNGSTDTLYGRIFNGDMRGFMVPCDGNEIFEAISGDTDVAGSRCFEYLTGYVISGFTGFTNATDASTGTASGNAPGTVGGTYQTTDLSSIIAAGSTAVLARIGDDAPSAAGATEFAAAVRPSSSTHDEYWDVSTLDYLIVGVGGDGKVEQQIESTEANFAVYGYFATVAAGGRIAGPLGGVGKIGRIGVI